MNDDAPSMLCRLWQSARITWRIACGPTRGWRWSVVRPYWLWLIESFWGPRRSPQEASDAT
jgi:hypothetical protein